MPVWGSGAGGMRLALEMPHSEKLLAETGGLIWGFGWWGTDIVYVTVTEQQGPGLCVPQGTPICRPTRWGTVGKGTPVFLRSSSQIGQRDSGTNFMMKVGGERGES